MALPAGVPGGMEKYRVTLTLSFFFKLYMTLINRGHKKSSEQLELSEMHADNFHATQVYRVTQYMR
jgi:hypothetical protein